MRPLALTAPAKASPPLSTTPQAQPHAALYLPISDETVLRLLNPSKPWSQGLLDRIGIPELSSLWLLAKLHTLPASDHSGVERRLAQIIDLLTQKAQQSGLDTLRATSVDHLDRCAIESGYLRLPEYRIQLLDDNAVSTGHYLTTSGQWDFQFNTRNRESIRANQVCTSIGQQQCLLSSEQSRIFREMRSQSDDHIHIHGYAGTGKTLLIRALCSLFHSTSARVLVIAERWSQLNALGVLQNSPSRVRAVTFGGLARLVTPDDPHSHANQTMLRKTPKAPTQSDEELIRYLCIHSSDEHDAQQIIIAVRSTLYRFCISGDSTLGQEHVPAYHAKRFSPEMQAVIAEYANQLWQTYLIPTPMDFQPVVREHHRLKWAALNRWPIPKTFTHVLVDESHNLPKPVEQILHGSPQARAVLGDDYQALSGHFSSPITTSRRREMVSSVRSGRAIESIVNPIIQHHPSPVKVPFVGNALTQLQVTYYDNDKAEIPDKPAAIVCSDTWALFEWVQRLTMTGQRIKLLGDQEYLSNFVYDCVNLKAGQRGPRHPELFRYHSWDQLAQAQSHRRAFRSIARMLDKGYTRASWHRASLSFDREGQVRYFIGRIDDIRNLEFDTVMLTPDCLDSANRQSSTSLKSTIYVAVTRARARLILPATIREWIESISA